jgi:hypothetical protein
MWLLLLSLFSCTDTWTYRENRATRYSHALCTTDSFETMETCTRYTIRQSHPAEFTGLDFEDEVESMIDLAKEPEKGTPKDHEGVSTRRSRPVSVMSENTTSAPKTRRRKRKSSLRLSESSSALKKVEQFSEISNSDVETSANFLSYT